ncbi:hypothetical protein ACSBR2_000720 [Camellia fascicularis]
MCVMRWVCLRERRESWVWCVLCVCDHHRRRPRRRTTITSPHSTTNYLTSLGLGYAIAIAIAIALGFLVLLSTLLLVSYICFRHSRRRQNLDPSSTTTATTSSDNGIILPRIIFVAEDDNEDNNNAIVGLDQAVINSYPRFPFSKDRGGGINDSILGLGYAIAIALSFLVLLSTLLLVSYVCFRHRRRCQNLNPSSTTTATTSSDNGIILPRIIFVAEDDNEDNNNAIVGLDQAVINSYPRFPFSKDRGGGINDSMCSICLCEYRDAEAAGCNPLPPLTVCVSMVPWVCVQIYQCVCISVLSVCCECVCVCLCEPPNTPTQPKTKTPYSALPFCDTLTMYHL